MGGIYIPGLSFPEKGNQLHFAIRADGKVLTDYTGTWTEYKAVAVPDHGRLIDVDALISHMKKDPLWKQVDHYGLESVMGNAATLIPKDRMEVVRCGECVHCIRQYGWPSDPEPELWCDGRGWPRLMVTADDFCSRGKKGETDVCTV